MSPRGTSPGGENLTFFAYLLVIVSLAGALFTVACAFVARAQLKLLGGPAGANPKLPPVTILRPLHGASPGLEEALASTLEQDYSAPVQLICGIQKHADPARGVVEALRQRFPNRDIELVVDPRLYGANRKISNLINMFRAARHDSLVIADADIVAAPNWLSATMGALARPKAGVASCFYIGEGSGPWGRLLAMGITYQFLPGAVFGMIVGLARPCFGATMALTRQKLAEIGGFEAFRDSLADDYEIGRIIRSKGYEIVYPDVLVRHLCSERNWSAFWVQELRWARTVRSVNPVGHLGSLLTHALPLSLIAAALLSFSPQALTGVGVVLAARLFLKTEMDHMVGSSSGPIWLLPVRDLLSFVVFVASLAARPTVHWRGDRFRIGKDGVMSQVSG